MRDVCFIGVDNGTQSTKVSIINQRGEVLLSASEPLRPMVSRQPGWAEHPDDDLWDSTKAALQTLMASFTGDVSDIKGIGLCSVRCCRVFMNQDGPLSAPVMSWMDVRAYTPFEDDPGIGYTGSTSGYLTFRLTGALKDTIANSYPSQFPVDMNTWAWTEDPDALSAFRIPRSKLLEMGLPGKILGQRLRRRGSGDGPARGAARGGNRERQGRGGPGVGPHRARRSAALPGHLRHVNGRGRSQPARYRQLLHQPVLHPVQVPV